MCKKFVNYFSWKGHTSTAQFLFHVMTMSNNEQKVPRVIENQLGKVKKLKLSH